MWQRKTPEDKRCHRHILEPFRPTGKERYRNAADKGVIQVIAGHRGWRGADYFRHIDRLAVGDTVTLTNLWETLTYTVKRALGELEQHGYLERLPRYRPNGSSTSNLYTVR